MVLNNTQYFRRSDTQVIVSKDPSDCIYVVMVTPRDTHGLTTNNAKHGNVGMCQSIKPCTPGEPSKSLVNPMVHPDSSTKKWYQHSHSHGENQIRQAIPAVSVSLPSSSALHRANTISQTCSIAGWEASENMAMGFGHFKVGDLCQFHFEIYRFIFMVPKNANKKESKHVSTSLSIEGDCLTPK